MNIVFIGAVEFSEHCLKVLLAESEQVVGVIVPEDASQYSDYADLKPLALSQKIEIYATNLINEVNTLEWIKSKNPDVIMCFGWSQLLGNELLSLAPYGVIGAHPAMIPKNRGRHPLIWAKALGLKESGLTFFKMDSGADSGDIISQQAFKIEFTDTARELYNKIKLLANKQIPEILKVLQTPNYKLMPQNLENGNLWRKRSPVDGIIDWRMSSEAIINLIRALTSPYPGAITLFNGQQITVWSADIYNPTSQDLWQQLNHEPGKCVALVKQLDVLCPIVKTYNGFVCLQSFEPALDIAINQYLN